ncbi:MAG: hypothetical protein ABIQ52_09535, partial [Vicinamibacterales bacterium]
MTTTGLAWRCACKRHVPAGVDTCRCGAGRPAFIYTPPDPLDAPDRRGTTPMTIAVAVLMAAGALSWFLTHRSAATSARQVQAMPVVAEASIPLAAAAPAPTPLADAPAAQSADASASLEDMIAASGPAVVLIEADTRRGTAFFVKPDLLISNAHVVKGATMVKMTFADG